MPFLVDSVTGALGHAGIDIHLIVHPQLVVRRDAVGDLEEIVRRDVTGRRTRSASASSPSRGCTSSRPREPTRSAEAIARRTAAPRPRGRPRTPSRTGRKMREQCLRARGRARTSTRPRASTPRRSRSTDPVPASGWPTTTSPSSATASTPSTPTTRARTCSPRSPASGLGHPALRPAGRPEPVARLSPQASARRPASRSCSSHQGQLALDGAPRRLPRLRRRQGLRRATASVIGRAAVPRPLRLHAPTPSRSSHIPLVAEKVQAVLERSGVAPDSHSGKDLLAGPRELPARRAVPDRARTSSYDIATVGDCTCRSAAAPSCSCARTTSAASSPAWSTSRATATTPTSGCGWRTSSGETFGGESRRLHDPGQRVGAGPAALRRPGAQGRRVRIPTGRRGRRSSSASSRSPAPGTSDLVDALRADVRRGGRRPADRTGSGGRSPRPTRRTFTSTRAVADLRRTSSRLGDDAGTSVGAATGPGRRRPTSAGSSSSGATRSSLTDVLPIFTHLGVEVIDERPYEITRADGVRVCTSTTSGCARPTPTIWDGVPTRDDAARAVRGRRSRGLGRPRRVRRLQRARARAPG